MATLQKRKSRGYSYWYIVESRRVNGKPRPITLASLGTAENLLKKLAAKTSFEVKSYSHGDTAALINIVQELDVIGIINRHVPLLMSGGKPIRDHLTVGSSLCLAAIGRACHPTSKLSWYEWCKQTSLEYCLRSSFSKLDSQHFWDQMHCLPVDKIALIEDELIKKIVDLYQIKPDCLFFDTTNFFTFIDSENTRCDLPQRGKNKQKRIDLRQFGVALLVTRKEQFLLFHKTYRGNENDMTFFKNNFKDLSHRLKQVFNEFSELTLVFDKGNNSKDNFALIDAETDLHYVAGLVPSYFKTLIEQANKNFELMKIDSEDLPVYRLKKQIWGATRTCVVTISNQLKEGQLRGIHQHLEKKYKLLAALKKQLENPNRGKSYAEDDIKERLTKIIRGQFIEDILKYEIFALTSGGFSFSYSIDNAAFDHLKNEILGRKILVTNRHDWTSESIILAYRGQAKVEYAFRNLKNPHHQAIRPQYHWTDQKIAVHVFICIIGYLLTVAAYQKAKQKAGYNRNLGNFLDDLRTIRLASIIENKLEKKRGRIKVNYKIEKPDESLGPLMQTLAINAENLKPKIKLSVYN